MSSSKRTADVIARRALREQQRRYRFGDDAACECCGDSTLTHLARIATCVACACCLAIARGREVLEVHHLGGRGEGPTVRVCANCHAELSELQRDWLDEPDTEIRLTRGREDLDGLRERNRSD
jgi:hypothetical protein